MKKIIILLTILFLFVGCTNVDDTPEDIMSSQEPVIEDESVPQEEIEPSEPEEVAEPDVPDETEPPAEETQPETIDAEEETKPDKPVGEKDFESLCNTEIPSTAEFIDEQYGSSHITYYKTNSDNFIGPYWKYYDSAKTLRLSFRCYDEKGEKNGPAADWDKDGNLEEEYFLKDGRYDGPYRIYYKGVLVEDMNYKDGEKHGVWTIYSDEGVIESIEGYENGGKHGIFKTYDDGNIRMEQEFDMGVKTPNIKMYYEDGSLESVREGKTVDNKFTGTFTTWQRPDKNGDQIGKECTFVAGVAQECKEI